MGLLDDLLEQLAGGNVPADAGFSRGPVRADAGNNLGPVVMALLPVVLGMLRSGGPGSQDASQAGSGGGFGAILAQVLGVGPSPSGRGALPDLLAHLQRSGLGDQVRSWISTGPNMPVESGDVERAFGRTGLAEIARRANVSEPEASQGLAQLMPELVDRMTPAGEVPDPDSLLASVDALAARLGAR